MKNRKKIVERGYEIMAQSNIAICSIVRNCGESLERNIPKVEKLRNKFKNSRVYIFENDSLDNTKAVLRNWNTNYTNVIVKYDHGKKETIPKKDLNGFNKNFSFHRISKMAEYRNQYLELLKLCDIQIDFLIVIDLDIISFEIDGLAHSFGLKDEWDVITANGYSRSKQLQKRYHDTYALTEIGKENSSQTEVEIFENQKIWAFLKPGLPLVPVYSAFGGLAIYHFDLIQNKKYGVVQNYDNRVEVKCEHFSLHQQIQKEGNYKIFINPNMQVFYQKITLSKIYEIILNLINVNRIL